MGKYERKKRQKRKPYKAVFVAVILIIAFVAFVLFVMPQLLHAIRGGEENNIQDILPGNGQTSEISETHEPSMRHDAVQLPILAEDGKIEIASIFQFDGINPDSEKQDGEGIAAITLTNRSEDYLASVTVRMAFADGTEHTFWAYGIPAGKTVMAFSVDHLPLSDGSACVGIHTECSFEKTQNDDRLEVSVSAMSITLSNVTDKELTNIVVYCHDVFDDKYFGGIVYMYTVDKIPAGESTTITASDSLMGVIDVVQIAADN